MKKNELTGKIFGDLKVLYFDEERHKKDTQLKKEHKINRIRRYWICECQVCGNITSVRGENLISGNSKGCGCNVADKISKANKLKNKVFINHELKCLEVCCYNSDKTFLIDIEMYELIKDYCWSLKNDGYFYTRVPRSKNKKILLHRYLKLGLDDIDKDIYVDHINRDRSDNRLSNLRFCNKAENNRNVSLSSCNTSGTIGVSLYKPNNKWRSFICVNKKFISLGYYNTKDEAIVARLKAERKYYKEFAPQKHLFKKYNI